MSSLCANRRFPLLRVCTVTASLVLAAGCTVGPTFTRPQPAAPDDWARWHGGDAGLAARVQSDAGLPERWWEAFGDPVLDSLLQRALAANADLGSAGLRFAQARVTRQAQGAQQTPSVDFSAGVTRQRQSEYGAGTRLFDAIGSIGSSGTSSSSGTSGTSSGTSSRQQLAKLLGEPFTLYQAGFDASWEIDLWGGVRRSLEAADADVTRQSALLDQARLSLLGETARSYLQLRGVQRRLALSREDATTLEQSLSLTDARVRGGVDNHLGLLRQRSELAGMQNQVTALLAQEAALTNQLTLLAGERPGALKIELSRPAAAAPTKLPELALGLPSEVAGRRPDVRAAEARLRSATANIGVAQAQLYPSIRLGAKAGLESYLSGEFSDWGSRTWSIGPSLSLPIFDGGRRKAQVQLRELDQQEAAIAYRQTVLQAWHEIDDALSAYAAEQQQYAQLEARVALADDSHGLARARYTGGEVDFSSVLDTQRVWLQARTELASSGTRLATKFVAINKAVGNTAPTLSSGIP